ncbi:hypothetical protein EWM64_g436 [Hericium alpestre]|uniref:Uncharacterized protein n=1 Tax=Hericium alpestre TaxID=135208 RepID=A0A4Z0AB42_9AGAM|nr:hypothetical protein EWM64_g436 [Hericium alpestre]
MPSGAAGAVPRASPFGAAKPVDVTAREKLITERLERDREVTKERVSHSMSRTSSRTGSDRNGPSRTSPHGSVPPSPGTTTNNAPANVRPAFSFAAAASAKKAAEAAESVSAEKAEAEEEAQVSSVSEQLGEVTI